MNLIIACETTGAWQWRLPDDDPAQPHVVRVASILEGQGGVVIDESSLIVQPDPAWVFEDGAVKAHGIGHDCAADRGVPIEDARAHLSSLMMMGQRLVGFSLDFQVRVLGRFFGTAALPTQPAETFCCMKQARDVVKKPRTAPGGGHAIPSLAETYWHVTGHAVPISDDPVEAGLLKVRAVQTIFHAISRERGA